MSRLDDLYVKFEQRFRGPRELVIERLNVYAPLLDIVERRHSRPIALDCGCGRGEWLQLLNERQWDARGIDLNPGMVKSAQAMGLSAGVGEVVEYLSGLPDGSLHLISAFHLVEHLPTEVLLEFLSQVGRVIAPSGVVIFETPNPENLAVGTAGFYTDPTHQRPLPPGLLQFFVEQAGIPTAEIVRLNGEVANADKPDSLEAALRPMFMSALDYAVIGTRSNDTALVNSVRAFAMKTSQGDPVDLSRVRAFNDAWDNRYKAFDSTLLEGLKKVEQSIVDRIAAFTNTQTGLVQEVHRALSSVHQSVLSETDQITSAFSDRQSDINGKLQASHQLLAAIQERLATRDDRLIENLTDQITAARQYASELERAIADNELQFKKQVDAANEESMRLSRALNELEIQLQEAKQSAESIALEAQQHHVAAKQIYASHSWRITAPLRLLGSIARRVLKPHRQPDQRALINPARQVRLQALIRHPLIWKSGRWVVRRLPGLRALVLSRLSRHQLLLNPLSAQALKVSNVELNWVALDDIPLDLHYQLTIPSKHAQRLYLAMWRQQKNDISSS